MNTNKGEKKMKTEPRFKVVFAKAYNVGSDCEDVFYTSKEFPTYMSAERYAWSECKDSFMPKPGVIASHTERGVYFIEPYTE